MATGRTLQHGFHLIPVRRKFKMVLLGITGSGKTSLIDLIGNYGNMKGCDINCLETYRKMENEDKSEEMESKTNSCVIYDMTINGVLMEIIDTPGLQDSRGAEKSQENIETIISTLKNGEYINCVCLVSNGRNARFDEITQKAISDILSILPQEVRKNTIIVYTNVASNSDISTDHKKIKVELGVSTLKGYVLDNAYCGWSKLGKEMDPDLGDICDAEADKQKIQKMLEENFKRLDVLFGNIKSLKSIPTDCFGDLRRISEQIQFLNAKLKALEKSKNELDALILSLTKELKDFQEGVSVIETRLDYVRTNTIETMKYNTVCMAYECFKNCHAPCIFTGMISRNVKECRCIQKDGNCNVCGHHYTRHAHRKFIFNEEEVRLRSGIKEKLSKAKTEEERTAAVLSEHNYQLEQLDYDETQKRTKIDIAILLAEFQRISSKSSYEKIIDNELSRFSKYFGTSVLPTSKKELMDHLGLTSLRDELIQIQDMPFGNEMSAEDKKIWALKILDIDADKQLTLDMISSSFRAESRKYLDVIKEGDDAIQKRQVHAKEILEQYIDRTVED